MRKTTVLTCILFFLVAVWGSLEVQGQDRIQGSVRDRDGLPIPGANLNWASNVEKGGITDFEGRFELEPPKSKDTLKVSALSFKTKNIPVSPSQSLADLQIVLKNSNNILKEVILVSRDPIAEKFAVSKIGQLDIHFNPVANDDPLNAIKILPAATNTSESAEPALRGGMADRSRVYVNGAPILKPVRNSQDNGLTNFSLFNTDMISQQYVFASNPPLTYGNSSAGVVAIETAQNLPGEDIRGVVALSGGGLMLNKRIGEKAFFQTYFNKQFSSAFKALNKPYVENLKSFSSIDAGLNFRTELSPDLTLNSFNYAIDEKYKAVQYRWNYSEDSEAQQKRFFSVNNLDYRKNRSFIRLSTLFDETRRNFQFGNLDSDNPIHKFYLSLSHKYKWSRKFSIQYGWDYFRSGYSYREQRPEFFYGLHPEDPTYQNEEEIRFDYHEVFFYLNYKLNQRVGVTGAVRKNLFSKPYIPDFWSYQVSGYYNLKNRHRFVLGVGNYNSYSVPNEYRHAITLLSSKQIALDYQLEADAYNFSGAIYYKKDKGEISLSEEEEFDFIKTWGLELSFYYPFNSCWSLGVSNTILQQKGYRYGKGYRTTSNLNYNLKAQLSYVNFKIVTASLALITRPGNHFTPIEGSHFNADRKIYQPVFGALNEATLPSYFRLDFTMNRAFDIGGNALIVYGVVNNILNTKNAAYRYYNEDFSTAYTKNYQNRIFYVGLQFRFQSLFR